MDNLTHTLLGAAMGRAGLARRTSLGMAAVMIGANLPDLDVLGLPFGMNLGFRRGITHGVLALAVWPFLLTGALLLWHRWRSASRPGRTAPIPRYLFLASTAGILSHPLLDWFNSYGMRWLMPFRSTWFYGDTWFIVDPWVLAVLGFAIWWGRAASGRQGNPAGPRVALALVAGYAVVMWAGTAVGLRAVRAELAQLGFAPPRQLMVTPVALNPLVRKVVVSDGLVYHRGTIGLGGGLRLDASEALEIGMATIDLVAVQADHQGRQFLAWSRFPFAVTRMEGDTTVVVLDDARYFGSGATFARTEVRSPTRR